MHISHSEMPCMPLLLLSEHHAARDSDPSAKQKKLTHHLCSLLPSKQ